MDLRDFVVKSLPLLEECAPFILKALGRPGLSGMTVMALKFLEDAFKTSCKDGLDDKISGHKKAKEILQLANANFEEWLHKTIPT